MRRSRAGNAVVRIRHISVKHFRGFDDFNLAVPDRLVLTGEPGAGRSDLIEALARVFDREYRRSRRPDEFDFYNLQTSEAAEVVVSLGDLGDTAASPLLPYVQFWDPASEAVVPMAADPAATTNLEEIVRLGYWLATRPDGTFDERTFWAKSWTSGQEPTQWVTASQHRLFPFLWQRGIESRPLDLGAAR